MLPKIDYPIHEFEIPSLGVTRKFRPFLVKEERILLYAKESDDPHASRKAVKQVINNAAIDWIDVDSLAIFDIAWLFIQLRIASVSNVVEQEYEDREDEKTYKVSIDLTKIKKPDIKNISRSISLPGGSSLILRWPNGAIFGTTLGETEAILACADGIINPDNSVTPIDSTPEEFNEWLELLPISVLESIDSFFSSVPDVELDVSYTNSLGTVRDIKLKGLSDFFDLR